jgi:signal transduction histidine kinase
LRNALNAVNSSPNHLFDSDSLDDISSDNVSSDKIAEGAGGPARIPARINVQSRAETRDGRLCIAITVEDNGSGIAADVLPDIFDAFVSTRLDARGTGLGLTVTEGIITQHAGTISASNRPEGGACLEVVLPAA